MAEKEKSPQEKNLKPPKTLCGSGGEEAKKSIQRITLDEPKKDGKTRMKITKKNLGATFSKTKLHPDVGLKDESRTPRQKQNRRKEEMQENQTYRPPNREWAQDAAE